LVFYDSKTYKRKTKTFEGMRGKSYIAFSVDGKYLVGSDARRLILWNAETSEKIKIFNNPQPLFPIPLFCVAFHPSGQYVAASCRRYVYLFSCKTGMFFKRYGKYKKLNCIAFSPDGNYLFCGTNKSLVVFKMIDEATLDYIATQLNLAQARLLYRLYQAKINKVPVMLDKQDADYQIYLSLPQDVQKVVKAFLTFTSTLDVAEKEVQEKEKMLQEKEKTLQEKMNELRSSLFYVKGHLYGKTEKMREQKIKALKDMMQKLEKDSVDYKACVKLLDELELEAAFETD
jgi:WD40 repeat protein